MLKDKTRSHHASLDFTPTVPKVGVGEREQVKGGWLLFSERPMFEFPGAPRSAVDGVCYLPLSCSQGGQRFGCVIKTTG